MPISGMGGGSFGMSDGIGMGYGIGMGSDPMGSGGSGMSSAGEYGTGAKMSTISSQKVSKLYAVMTKSISNSNINTSNPLEKTSSNPDHYSDSEIFELEQQSLSNSSPLSTQHQSVLNAAKGRSRSYLLGMSGEELFGRIITSSSQDRRIEPYSFDAFSARVGNSFITNVLNINILGNEKKSLGGVLNVLKTIEMDAWDSGASELIIRLHNINLPRFKNPELWNRMGYSYSADHQNVISLKKSK